MNSDFRSHLRSELARRCSRNPQYSLRAFAKFLGVDHATLSQLLRGRRRLTDRTVRKLALRLGLDDERIAAFVEATRDAEPPSPSGWTRDAAALVSDWRHHAILELVHEPEFRPDIRWIARVLGCAPDEVAIAVQRLLRTGLLRMTAADRWDDTCTGRPSSFADFAYEAVRRVLDPHRNQTGGP